MTDRDHQAVIAASVIRALRDGYGVEDIAVKGIATLDEARSIVDRLRRLKVLTQVYPRPKLCRGAKV